MKKWFSRISLATCVWLVHAALASAQMQVFPPNYVPKETGAFDCNPNAPVSQTELQPENVQQPWSFAIPFEDQPLPNGFSEYETAPYRGLIYAGLGFQALRREGFGDGNIALTDPTGIDNLIPGLPPGVPAVTFSGLYPQFNWGPRATLGVAFERSAFEATGFYLFRNSTTFQSIAPGRLNVLFGGSPPPIGFGGNLWNQADKVEYGLGTTMGSFEVNYRHRNTPWFEWLLGVRYMYLAERFNIFTDDDSISAPPVIPARLTDYIVQTRNHIIAPQFGFAMENRPVPIFSVSFDAKGAVGVNFADVQQQLMRGDGFIGPSGTRNANIVTSIVELRLFGTFYFTDNVRFRAGYNTMWLINVPEAHAQVDFNPAIAGGNRDNGGSIFYHGPMLEFQVGF